MIVSKDQSAAIVGYYRVLRQINAPYRRLKLSGLNPEFMYSVSSKKDLFYGQELMKVGLIISDSSAGENNDGS
ncbi:GH36 C-terminal domain-containing protein [Dubosiella newyorkensis]|nr:GH36 C-terminal domain-containing protein [Dubosiella newyorkensis]